MAQTQDHSNGAAPPVSPPVVQQVRLQRYLPPNLVEAVSEDMGRPGVPSERLLEALVHLASSRSTIATYLPRLVVQQVLDARRESPWLHWVDGSLLFADLSGSTALAERLSALGREGTELVTEFLNHIFATMIRVIQDYGGDLVSFGGDALLVFFGDERHPRTAARAALALQDALHGYVKTIPGVGTFPMHLHVGVESGRVAFVSAGLPHARYYSVLGATVNRVAMAEGYAEPGEVVAGPSAWATLAAYAAGEEVAPGFARIRSMRAPLSPHEPAPDEPMLAAAPEVAIPLLLDDLDRISPYIPPVLLGRILLEPHLPQIEADLRPVTVLFAQAVGLEALAEALPAERAGQVVQAYVAVMQAAVEQFGGVVNKIDVADEGIKLVAIFGAPAAYEDHAERAARAALEMQTQIENVELRIENVLNEGQFSILNSQFSILKQRIGLNLGTAFAGNVGSVVRKEYTVMGDAVNVAARVMSKAAWGEVWCSEATTQVIAVRMVCEDRGHVALKGKAVPLQLFKLCGSRDMSATARAVEQGPLIGRADELAWLREHLSAAIGGAGRAARIVGTAGVGKSRLTAALLEGAAAHGVRVIPATCFSYTAGIPYAAWAEWLKSLCDIASGDDDDERVRKISARLAELGPGMEEWLPILGDLARLDVPDNRLTRGLDPQMRQRRRFELLEQLLLRAADAGPVLTLFENLHWADPISLDLWRHMTTVLDGRPVLLLGAHRPTPALGGDGAELLELRELSAQESNDLIDALAGDTRLPDPLLRQLVARSAGNPLFLAELLRVILLRLENVVETQNIASLRHSPISNLQLLEDLPESLNGLLLSRIDQLDDVSRGVLRVASVIGQRIPFEVLQALQSADPDALLRQLARLDEEDLTALERAEPERVDTFRQALYQEVAYQSLLYARRRELHGRIGDYLERRHADDLDDYYGLLAHHYRLSDRRDRAITYLLKAGHAARDVYANEEAMQYYGWALDALAGDEADPHTWETRDALGDIYATVGRYDDALTQHAAILAAPGVTPDVARKAHRKRGSVLEKQGQYAPALEELDRAMAIARSGVPGISPLAIPLICADVALVHKRRGEYDLAISVCEEGLAAILDDPLSHDDEMIEARLNSELGGIYGMRGDYPRAQHHFAHSLRLREAVDDLPGMIFSHNNLGYLWQLQSEYERAIGHYQIAEELARKINLRFALVFAVLNTAYALSTMGMYMEAEVRCAEALTLSREMNAQQNIAQIHNTLGYIFYHKGDYERALAAYDEALLINRSLGSTHQEANNLMNKALTLNAMNSFDLATDAAQQALAHAEALQGQLLKVEALNALAEATLGSGDLVTARAYAQAAAALGGTIGSKRDVGVSRRLLGQFGAAGGEPFADDFEKSIALFEVIKDRFELARTWAAYGTALATTGNEIDGQAYLKQAWNTFVAIGAHGEVQRLASTVERSV